MNGAKVSESFLSCWKKNATIKTRKLRFESQKNKNKTLTIDGEHMQKSFMNINVIENSIECLERFSTDQTLGAWTSVDKHSATLF